MAAKSLWFSSALGLNLGGGEGTAAAPGGCFDDLTFVSPKGQKTNKGTPLPGIGDSPLLCSLCSPMRKPLHCKVATFLGDTVFICIVLCYEHYCFQTSGCRNPLSTHAFSGRTTGKSMRYVMEFKLISMPIDNVTFFCYFLR